MNYLEEIREWQARVDQWCGSGARLVHVSSVSSDVRVYRTERSIFKVRRLSQSSVHDRPNSLEDEFLVLRHLAAGGFAAARFPEARRYFKEEEWECIELSVIAPPETTDPVAHPFRETIRGLARLAAVVWRLNAKGISHGDLEPANAGTNADGTVSILDFDQAVPAHRIRCVLRDFLGVAAGGRASRCSLLERSGRLPLLIPLVRAMRAIKRRLGGSPGPDHGPWSLSRRIEARADASLTALAAAWHEAAASGANSPGGFIAYYSLDVDGVHFPGERPWLQRWDAIARAVDFRGKRLVELGCNMGLLSIHARLAGASASLGLDASAGVIRSARMVADAFGVTAEFGVADFDRDADWEARAGAGDIVSALSLTYWLTDKERLWRYLARFDEVLFEGHEDDAETKARFASLGFETVVEVGRSERRRMVFLGRRCRTKLPEFSPGV